MIVSTFHPSTPAIFNVAVRTKVLRFSLKQELKGFLTFPFLFIEVGLGLDFLASYINSSSAINACIPLASVPSGCTVM
jgi:hypothetical protein